MNDPIISGKGPRPLEILKCVECEAEFNRERATGPKPKFCPTCREKRRADQNRQSVLRYMKGKYGPDRPREPRGRVGPKQRWDDLSVPWRVRRPDGVSVEVPAAIRFWTFVEVGLGFESCWLWQGSVTPGGYGVLAQSGGESWMAHRLAYEMAYGPIPDGLVVDHLCRIRHCVNPFHMEAVTQQQNALRGAIGAKTHCRYGHEYIEENTIRDRFGYRRCKECRDGQSRRRKSMGAAG